MSENKKKRPTKAAPKGNTKSMNNSKKQVGISTTQPDLSATLDHILTVGAKVRHDSFRQTMFATTQEPRLRGEYSAKLDKPSTRPRPGAPPAATRMPMLDNQVHAEDVRLYGTSAAHQHSMRSQRFDGLAQYPWPSIEYEKIPATGNNYIRPPQLKTDDTQWNLEHGDIIHPLAFSKAKLSGVPLEDEDRAFVDGNNMFVGKTETAVEDAQVPRALLLRCWERAVHAASNTSCVPVGGGGGGGDQAFRLLQRQQAAQVQSTREEARRRSDVETTQGQKESQEHHEQSVQEPVSSRTRDRPTQIGTGVSDQPLELEVEPVGTATATAKSVNPVRMLPTKGTSQNQEEKKQALHSYIQNIQGVAGGPRFGETAQDYSRTAALKKCQEWGIKLPKWKFVCQNCKLRYETQEELDTHFHGSGNQQGCCWSVIHKKQREELDSVMQENVKCHTEAILELVMSKAKDKNPPQGSGNKRARLINWYDVLQYAQSEYQQAKRVKGSPKCDHPVLETTEIKASPHRSPLVLNQMVLDALRRRLVDRYADVPS